MDDLRDVVGYTVVIEMVSFFGLKYKDDLVPNV